jgi:hypothetical protein
MTQALYAHMNNKRKKEIDEKQTNKQKTNIFESLILPQLLLHISMGQSSSNSNPLI